MSILIHALILFFILVSAFTSILSVSIILCAFVSATALVLYLFNGCHGILLQCLRKRKRGAVSYAAILISHTFILFLCTQFFFFNLSLRCFPPCVYPFVSLLCLLEGRRRAEAAQGNLALNGQSPPLSRASTGLTVAWQTAISGEEGEKTGREAGGGSEGCEAVKEGRKTGRETGKQRSGEERTREGRLDWRSVLGRKNASLPRKRLSRKGKKRAQAGKQLLAASRWFM